MWYDAAIVALALALTNLRATIFFSLYPDPSSLLGRAWLEIAFWLLTTLAAGHALARHHLVADWLSIWRRNWPLAVFVLLCAVSAIWSIAPVVTLFRASELLCATLSASYVGTRYRRPDQLLTILFWFGAALLVVSLVIVFGLPDVGQRLAGRTYRSWRGFYWHKNHLGSIVALVNIVFLCRAIIAFQRLRRVSRSDAALYGLSLVVLYFAYSVTGYFLSLVMHGAVVGVWLWIKVGHRLGRRYYYAALGAALAGLAVILSHLGAILGVFDRSPTLSGRVDLWSYLWHDVMPESLWWGRGFGATWTVESFRVTAQRHVRWASQVIIADNGFLDILLHVGLVGFVVFATVLTIAMVRSCRYALAGKTLADAFPLLIVLYACIGNIAFSLFAETELFVWWVVVVVLFMTTPLPPSGSRAERPRAHGRDAPSGASPCSWFGAGSGGPIRRVESPRSRISPRRRAPATDGRWS
jgi:exopolysaccharide production protein ExoQ